MASSNSKRQSAKDKLRSIVRKQVTRAATSAGEDNLMPVQTVAKEQVRKKFKADPETGTILLSAIDPDPEQVRKVDTTSDEFSDLVTSIRQHGVLQPITVRWREDRQRFQVITGERRYRAAKRATLERVPAVIKDVDDTRKAVQQLVENIQRENLNPIEEAKAFQRYLAATGKTHQELARDIAKSRTYVTKSLSILEGLSVKEQNEVAKRAPAHMPTKTLILEALRATDPSIRAQILAGGLTRKEARTVINNQSPRRGRKRHVRRAFSTTKVDATVSVIFNKPRVSDEEVLEALEEAAAQQKKRLAR